MTDRLERNKQTVASFYDLMFNQCRPAEAIEKHAGEVYTQHNPRLDAGGKIVEHWDVLQVVPEAAANNNTMF